MNTNEIRRTFLDFFAERDHAVVPSAPLIPVDPTLLLTNAGMVPFKAYMLGEEKPPYRRAVTVQKCARTVDIDIIGTTARHLTFFQMLGNFSFGDYFKEKAIPWAYELVTDGFGLDPGRLWYTVHETDDEAEQIWIDHVGVPVDRVQRRGKDNFWQMGVPGPCGPASEIFYDKGPDHGPDGGPVVDEERFTEIWNLVFMQHIQDEPYRVVGDLPAKNIDTGAGLERIAMVLQNVESAFEIDEMRPIVAAAEAAAGVTLGAAARTDISLKIMADHARAVTFLIADRVVPSNEGRGYVLRRLLRRLVRHASLLGVTDLVVPRLVAATVGEMGEAYPEIREKEAAIVEMAEREETRFRRTLESGHQLLDEELAGMAAGEVFSGAAAFKLHDTYGFPRELTEEILAEKGLELDIEEFNRMMEEQRERARRHYRGGDTAARAEAYRGLLAGVDETDFVGYETEAGTGRILAIIREGEAVERAEEGQDVEVFLDQTPFYAESGGQVGDTGTVTTPTGTVRITDTQYVVTAVHGHRGTVASGAIQVGQETETAIDRQRREWIRKNHTGTHILHAVLREVVGDHVHQAGSLVAPDRLRFDFSHFDALDREQIGAVEHLVNERIIANAGVTTLETSRREAEAMGALAFFGDKYGERVRVVSMGGYSTELCGGTHVPTTGQVGPLVLVTEGSVAANTRRVEALTGLRAFEHLLDVRSRLDAVAERLRSQPGQVVDAAQALLDRLEAHEERIEKYEAGARSAAATGLLDQAESVGDHRALVALVPDLDADGLRSLALQVRDRLGSGAGVIGSRHDGKAILLAWVSDGLAAAGLSAGDLVAEAARRVGGGGSRDPRLAQGGGPRADALEAALDDARDAVRAALREV